MSSPVTMTKHIRDKKHLSHDDNVTVNFRGVSVTITLRDLEYAEATNTNPDTVLVLIDTTDTVTPLSIQINDDPAFEGVV